MTPSFKYALAACGLSQQEASEYLGIGLGSIKHMTAGRRPVPDGAWEMLADLYARIEDAANFAADQMADNGVDPRAFLNISADDGADPLPEGSARIAGAMALMMALYDQSK